MFAYSWIASNFDIACSLYYVHINNNTYKSSEQDLHARLPAHHNALTALFCSASAVQCIRRLKRALWKARKYPPHLRMVIDRDHQLALAVAHDFGHTLILLEFEGDIVACHLPVGRIQIEEGVGPVVPLNTVLPVQVLDRHAAQTQIRLGSTFFNAQQIDGRPGGGCSKTGISELSAETMAVHIVEPRRALNFGQRFGTGHFLPFEHLTAGDRPFELTDKLFQMMLHDPVQIDQFTIQIVDDFDGRGFGPHEEQRGGAAKDFDIAVMRRK